MKQKYYLRGLGIGMVVTALLMGVFTKDRDTMTDAEIKQRALELGMVEQITLADIRDNAPANTQETVSETDEDPDVVKEPEITDKEDVVESADGTERSESATEGENSAPEVNTGLSEESSNHENSETLTEDVDAETTKTPEETAALEETTEHSNPDGPEDTEIEKITITVRPGDSSETVSRRLEEAGLIDSAEQFNQYLLDHGLETVILVGEFEIPKGSEQEEISRIITK